MIVLDANYVLRYLLDDNHAMFLEAKEVVENSPCLVLDGVMAEVIYVLEGYYAVPRERIARVMTDLVAQPTLSMHESKTTIAKALTHYVETRLDFVDCYLCALGEKYEVKSFDKGVVKCLRK